MTDIELEQFITEYGGDIYSFCCCLTGSRQEADDLYQDTFLKAVEKKDILDAAGNPKSYLLSVAARLWKNQRRKAAWRKRIADVEQAMQAGWSTAPDNVRALGFGAGMGLPNMKKYSDEMRIDSVVGEGTTVYMTVLPGRKEEGR